MIKRIVFVSAYLEKGGIERVVNILANRLVDLDYEVTIIVINKNPNNLYFNPKIKIIMLPHNAKSARLHRVIKKIHLLHNYLKKGNYDVILALGPYVAMYTAASKIGVKSKYIASERSDPRRDPKNPILRKIRDISLKKADYIVFQTEDAMNYFSDFIKAKGIIIPNPIIDNLPDRYTGIRKKTFVNFCRFTEQKNLPLLIDAFIEFNKIYPEYSLNIYGEGELKDELENRIQVNKAFNYIKVYGFSTNIHEIVKDCTAFISSSDYEGISNSMLEAMAIGLPCICTDCPVGGAKMFIKNGVNGFLVSAGNKNSLVKAMVELVENPELSDQISKNSIDIRKKLSKDQICNMWVDCIRMAMKGK